MVGKYISQKTRKSATENGMFVTEKTTISELSGRLRDAGVEINMNTVYNTEAVKVGYNFIVFSTLPQKIDAELSMLCEDWFVKDYYDALDQALLEGLEFLQK